MTPMFASRFAALAGVTAALLLHSASLLAAEGSALPELGTYTPSTYDFGLPAWTPAPLEPQGNPTAAAKAWAWQELVARPQESARSTHERLQLALGFWRGAGDEIRDVLRPYVERYLAQVPPLEGPLGDAAFGKIAAAAFPAVMVEPATADLVAARLADASLGVASRRALGDGLADLRLALHARATFG